MKHPPQWRLHQSTGVVSLSEGSANVGIRCLDDATRKQIEALYPVSKFAGLKLKKVKIGNLFGKQSSGLLDIFDSDDDLTSESLTIARGDLTYEITWTFGRGPSNAPESFESICHEMVSTFRFVDIKHSDYLRYEDPLYGFGFEYPHDWILNSGGTDGRVNVMNGSPLLICVEVRVNKTFEDFLREQGNQVTGVEEKKEHFSHQLVGRRFRWLDCEAYFLESKGNAYLVRIREAPELGSVSRKSIDDFLSSFRS